MYNDPDLAIQWPMKLIGGEKNLIISEKDKQLLSLHEYEEVIGKELETRR